MLSTETFRALSISPILFYVSDKDVYSINPIKSTGTLQAQINIFVRT